jgi:hypothetical protein
MVETCSTSYVYIKQAKHIPTSIVSIEDIPTLLVALKVVTLLKRSILLWAILRRYKPGYMT